MSHALDQTKHYNGSLIGNGYVWVYGFLNQYEQRVENSGSNIAILDSGSSLSYSDCDQRSLAVLDKIIHENINQGCVVAVYFESVSVAVFSILAILKYNCTYLPLDPVYPENRLKYMLEKSGAELLITDKKEAADLFNIKTLFLNPGFSRPVSSSVKTLSQVNNEIAYIIFTSGSTGNPKGVRMPGRLLSNLVKWQNSKHPVPADMRTAQFSRLSFDVSFQEIFSTLCSGGQLVLIPEHVKSDFKELLNFIIDQQVERLFMPYIALHHLAQWACRLNKFPMMLKQVITAGEQLIISDDIRTLFKHCDQAVLYNQYGPSETHVVTEYELAKNVDSWPKLPPIGKAIDMAEIYLLDEQGQQVSAGEVGEVVIGGDVLAQGYINDDDQTSSRFVQQQIGDRKLLVYKTGDMAVQDNGGNYSYKDRQDNQIKISGYRVETSEVESALLRLAGVSQAAVCVSQAGMDKKELVAFLVPESNDIETSTIRQALKQELPDYMIPKRIVLVERLEKTPSGKVDRKQMLECYFPEPVAEKSKVESTFEQYRRLISEELGLETCDENMSLPDQGMDSLAANGIAARFHDDIGIEIAAYQLFQFKSLGAFLDRLTTKKQHRVQHQQKRDTTATKEIAIIGMALTVPGAESVAAFWDNLVAGNESVEFFDTNATESGLVNVRGLVKHPLEFDAQFFGVTPMEAEFIDPQQRVMLEQSWSALEDAGIDPETFNGRIGVFCGTGNNSYYLNNVLQNQKKLDSYGSFQAMIANEKDYVATRISHKLNLTGPSLSIVTACSTSLVAVAEAVESLRSGACDVAIAGAASLTFPQQQPYQYQEGGIYSKDGHTRAFDEDSNGTVFSDGCGIVVLKRLDYALNDHDRIYAVIKGAAINNDGAEKGSYSAPSIEGQKNVIVSAQLDAGIKADEIGYVEAHGTATPLGDPIEVAALKEAFSLSTDHENYCGLGSVKSNIGHLTAAAGVVGLIKTALMLKQAYLPATINLKQENRELALDHSPFYLTKLAQDWSTNGRPRIAAVSSFGIGGTNAHVIVAEHKPEQTEAISNNGFKLPLCISGKTPVALQAYLERYQQFLQNTDQDINQLSLNVLNRRRRFDYRCSFVANDIQSLASKVQLAKHKNLQNKPFKYKNLVYLFPGQGTQTADMGKYLYTSLPLFKKYFDHCSDGLQQQYGLDLKALLLNNDERLNQTEFAQPALFSICYALGKTLEESGAPASHSFGHSIGELVSATLSGVFDLETALRVVVCRGQVMQAQPVGDMIAVNADADSLQQFVNDDVVIAVYNTRESSVLSGPSEAITSLTQQLDAKQISYKQLVTSHAFHSPLMSGAVDEFMSLLADIELKAPHTPFISCVSGDWISDSQATRLSYWAEQIRKPVQFVKGCETLSQLEDVLLLELGPRQVLSGLVLQNMADKDDLCLIPVMRNPGSEENESQDFSAALGQLWEFGAELNWSVLSNQTELDYISLPLYPFQRKVFYIEPDKQTTQSGLPFNQQHSATLAVSQMDGQADMQEVIVSGVTMADLNQKDILIEHLKQLFSDASGLSLDDADINASFFELGFDSLFLTQAVIQIKKEFKVEITFRELLNECSSFDGLANHLLDQGVNLNPVSVAAGPALTPDTVMNLSAGAQNMALADSNLGALLSQQMQLINNQMQLLNNIYSPQAIQSSVQLPVQSTVVCTTPEQAAENTRPFGASVRINVKRSNELTGQQQRYLDEVIERYIGKLKKSKDFSQENRKRLADPRVVSGFRNTLKEIIFPVVVEKSAGAYLWDIDGNKYIDISCGFGSNFFGNGAGFIRQAIEEQLHKGYEIGPQSPLVADVSRRFCEMTKHDRVAFCNTGSEAVLGAVRLARTFSAKDKIVMFEDDYHGINDEVVVHRGANGISAPAAAGIPRSAVRETVILDYDNEKSLQYIQQNADEIAAILVEPVQSRNPDLQPKAFLQQLRTICTDHNIVLIFDEVITGLRLHPEGAQGYFGVKADLATYGKVIGGGMPIGLIAGKTALMDALDGGYWQYGDDSAPEVGVTYFAGTFVRHPLALAAANAVLQKLEDSPGIQDSLNQITAAMVKQLNDYCSLVGVPVKIPHCGSLFKIKIPQDIPYEELIYVLLREKGIHIWDARPCFLTLAHSEADIENFVSAFKQSVDEMLTMGFLYSEMPEKVVQEKNINQPPVPGARLGKDSKGNPAWFSEDPERPGKYLLLEVD